MKRCSFFSAGYLISTDCTSTPAIKPNTDPSLSLEISEKTDPLIELSFTPHSTKIGHIGDILLSQSLGLVLKTKPNATKPSNTTKNYKLTGKTHIECKQSYKYKKVKI